MKRKDKIMGAFLFASSLGLVVVAMVNIVPILTERFQREQMEQQINSAAVQENVEPDLLVELPVEVDFASLAEISADAVAGSDFRSNAHYIPGSRVITFSTCSYEYDDARYLLTGILVPLAQPQ